MAFIRPGKCLLRSRLRIAKMTQQELADRTRLSRVMITHFVTGRRIMNLASAKSISEVLGCEIEELYTWEIVRDSEE